MKGPSIAAVFCLLLLRPICSESLREESKNLYEKRLNISLSDSSVSPQEFWDYLESNFNAKSGFGLSSLTIAEVSTTESATTGTGWIYQSLTDGDGPANFISGVATNVCWTIYKIDTGEPFASARYICDEGTKSYFYERFIRVTVYILKLLVVSSYFGIADVRPKNAFAAEKYHCSPIKFTIGKQCQHPVHSLQIYH